MSSNDSRNICVAAEGLRQPVEGHLLAKAIGDVAQVDQQRGPMPFENLCMKVFTFPAPHTIDEMLHMTRSLLRGAGRRNVLDRHALTIAFGKELAVPDHAFVRVELVGDLPLVCPRPGRELHATA